MANKNLFKSTTAKVSPTATNRTHTKTPETDAVNNAGGVAYTKTEKATLSQIAVTNTFNGTFYASAEQHLELAKKSALALKNTSVPNYASFIPVTYEEALIHTYIPELLRRLKDARVF